MKKKLKDYKKLVYSLRFSLEIEAEFPQKVDIMNLRQRYRKLLNSWVVTTDTSLNNGLEFKPANKNKLKFNKECLAEISEILHIIRKNKGEVDGDKCGLHLHVDASRLSNKDIIKIIKEMMTKQSYMIRDFKVYKERLEKYCQYIKKSDVRNLNEVTLANFRKNIQNTQTIKYFESKYYVLNVKSLLEFNTIEFRIFNGTKYLREITKIIKYVFEFLINALERE